MDLGRDSGGAGSCSHLVQRPESTHGQLNAGAQRLTKRCPGGIDPREDGRARPHFLAQIDSFGHLRHAQIVRSGPQQSPRALRTPVPVGIRLDNAEQLLAVNGLPDHPKICRNSV